MSYASLRGHSDRICSDEPFYPNAVPMVGKKFGRLRVVGLHPKRSSCKSRRYFCLCDCGNTSIVDGTDLRSGKIKSCGCLREEILKKHGLTKHPLYKKWVDIKRRAKGTCNEKTNRTYADVSICDEWMEFKPFYDWSITRWKPGLEIDRIDTKGDYSPNNCRYVKPITNRQNMSSCKWWVVFGRQYKSLTDAAKILGCSKTKIFNMCSGYTIGNKTYPPEPFCYAVNKYN